jgi:hypothetical protein
MYAQSYANFITELLLWFISISLISFFACSGMGAGLPKYVPVNLEDIEAAGFKDGEEVSLESLKSKGLINPSGRERRLPLKVCMLLIT